METLEEDNTQMESKEADDNQGNIRHRLRDRDLLRKRKAEAEEKATYQWVHGATGLPAVRHTALTTSYSNDFTIPFSQKNGVQSKRPRVARDKSGQGKIGRPRKADAKAEPEPARADVPPEPTTVEELPPLQAASLPEPAYQGPPPPLTFSPMPLSFAPVLIQPEVEIIPVLSEVEKPDTEPKTGQLVEELLIEDLGPDEQEDISQPKELLLPDLGTNEELTDNKADNSQASPTPKFILPALEENLPSSVS